MRGCAHCNDAAQAGNADGDSVGVRPLAPYGAKGAAREQPLAAEPSPRLIRSVPGSAETGTAPAGHGGQEARAFYFTSKTNTVPRRKNRSEVHVVAKRCSSRFCPDCCLAMGLELKGRLQAELATWSGLQMWTLTIDPKLFENPEAAYRYERERRCIAKLVKRLHEQGHLRSRKWIVVVEWQRETEMAHWHLLLETNFVPFEAVARAWGRFRPKSSAPWAGDHAKPLKGQPPEFGHVRFSKGRGSRGGEFADSKHAAGYVCKYLTKHPEQGYPEWVVDFAGQIRRFATSRCVVLGKRRPPAEEKEIEPGLDPASHGDECFCTMCRGDIVFIELEAPHVEPPKRTTVRKRVARCGQAASLVSVEYGLGGEGAECVVARRFITGLRHVGFPEVPQVIGRELGDVRRAVVSWREARRLLDSDEWRGRQEREKERRDRRRRYDAMMEVGIM